LKSQNTALSLGRTILKQIVYLVYPNHCLHCQEKLASRQWLCFHCSIWLTPKEPITLDRIATLEGQGPALCLLQAMDGVTQDRMAYSAAALILLQIERLKITLPDIVCVFPKDRISVLIAQELSKMLSIELVKPLHPPSLRFPTCRWKKGVSLCDKRVFFVGLWMASEEEITMLYEAAPKELVFLSLF